MATANRDDEGTPQDKFWGKTINGWKSKAKKDRAQWNKLSAMYRTMANPRGDADSGISVEDAINVESNWIFAFADTLAANVVPSNPAVTVKANKAENDNQAKLRTQLVNTLYNKENLQSKLWQMTVRASVWPRCFMKCVWQHDLGRPILRVIKPHNIFYDLNAESEDDIKYVIEVTVVTRSEFEGRVKKKGKSDRTYRADALDEDQVTFGNWPKWLEPDDAWSGQGSQNTERSLVRDNYEWVVVYEVYDLVSRKFYHYADGVPKALCELDLPYKHLKNPFKLMVFNDNLQDLGGMSDAELIAPTVERINEMDTLQMTHVKTSIPSLVVHKGLVDDDGDLMDALLNVNGPGQPIVLEALPRVGIDQVLGVTPMPSLPVEWSRARQDLEGIVQFVLGMPSYQRGEVGQSDVATELALTDTATRTRNARRQKVIYDVIEWTAMAILALYQEFMEEDSEIPVRLVDTENEQALTRELLEFGEDSDDTWGWDYQAHPYTAAEQNEVVQLKTMETYLPVLLQGVQLGLIDQRKFFKKLLELMHMPDLLADPQAPTPPPDGAGAMGPGEAPLPAGPEGMSGLMPNAAQPAMQGGEVAVGSGAQAVPGGMEGGFQGN